MSEPMKVEICEHCGKPGDYPLCAPPYKPRRSRIKELSDRLSAETQRREAAEAVVDAHWHENEAQLLADAYREKYPA